MQFLRIADVKVIIAFALCLACTFNPAFAFEAFITNERSGDLISIDSDGNTVLVLPICGRPRGMVKGPAKHQLFIACSDDSKVLLFNTKNKSVENSFENLEGALTLAIHSPSNRLFLTNEGKAQATVINFRNGETLAVLPTGLEPDGIAVTNDGTLIFIASENAGLVHVYDGHSYVKLADIVTHLRPRRIAISDKQLWISSEMGSRVEIFSTETFKKIDEIIFAPRGFRSEQLTPVDILFDNTETLAFVALGSANNVAIVNVSTREVLKYILVGKRAWGLGLSPDNKSLIVLNGLSDDFTIIDIESRRPRVTRKSGLIPHAVAVF